jgi:predicted alpha/beta-hydrolase family hydrolase
MKIIILPGTGKSNKEWIDNAEKFFLTSDTTSKRYIQYYSHWNNDGVLDLNLELEKLSKEVTAEDECIVFAKSAGSILTINAVTSGLLKPSKCIFVGLPIALGDEDSLDTIKRLESFNVPTIVIQKTNDSVASYDTVRKVVEKYPNIKLIEIPGDNHKYDDFELINSLIAEDMK